MLCLVGGRLHKKDKLNQLPYPLRGTFDKTQSIQNYWTCEYVDDVDADDNNFVQYGDNDDAMTMTMTMRVMMSCKDRSAPPRSTLLSIITAICNHNCSSIVIAAIISAIISGVMVMIMLKPDR